MKVATTDGMFSSAMVMKSVCVKGATKTFLSVSIIFFNTKISHEV